MYIYVPLSHGDKHCFKVMFHYPKHVFKSLHAWFQYGITKMNAEKYLGNRINMQLIIDD